MHIMLFFVDRGEEIGCIKNGTGKGKIEEILIYSI